MKIKNLTRNLMIYDYKDETFYYILDMSKKCVFLSPVNVMNKLRFEIHPMTQVIICKSVYINLLRNFYEN